jgi:hypothetical protein
MLFTLPEVARWGAERQAVEFGVEIGACCGVVRVPRRVLRRLLPERPPKRCVEAHSGPFREHRRAAAEPAPVDRGRECGDQRAGLRGRMFIGPRSSAAV